MGELDLMSDSPGTIPYLAVLAYHKIGAPPAGGPPTWFYVSSDTFERHLAWLSDSRWRVIDAPGLLAGLATPERLPEFSVLLTFDDGYQSMRQVALPLLRAFGFPAVLFVPTAFIGLSNLFDKGIEPEEPICGWDDLRALQREGVSIQSHGVFHRRFSALSESQQEDELRHSRAVLETRLEATVEMFSFPYGDTGGTSATAAAALGGAGYKAGYLYGGGPQSLPVLDVYQITRVPMGPNTDLMKALDASVDRSAIPI